LIIHKIEKLKKITKAASEIPTNKKRNTESKKGKAKIKGARTLNSKKIYLKYRG